MKKKNLDIDVEKWLKYITIILFTILLEIVTGMFSYIGKKILDSFIAIINK